jgi:hypothetical protein
VIGPGHCSYCGEGCETCDGDGCLECESGYNKQGGICSKGSSVLAYLIMVLVIITSIVGTYTIYKWKIVKDNNVRVALGKYYNKLITEEAAPLEAVATSENTNIAVAMPVLATGTYKPQVPSNPKEDNTFNGDLNHKKAGSDDENFASIVSYRDEAEEEDDDGKFEFEFEDQVEKAKNPYA